MDVLLLIISVCFTSVLCTKTSNITGDIDLTNTTDPSTDLDEVFTRTGTVFPPIIPESATEPTTSTDDRTESSDSPRSAAGNTPLLDSGALPVPLTDVSKLCPCNLLPHQCDVNCCCDPDCGEEVQLFTDCTVKTVSTDRRLCRQDTAVYSLSSKEGFSTVQSSVQQEVNPDILCIHTANYEEGLSFGTPPIPTEDNFDALFGQVPGFIFGRSDVYIPDQSANVGNFTGYMYGDIIQTANGTTGSPEYFMFPAAAGTAHCLDLNPAAFLKDEAFRCMRNFDLASDCAALKTLDMRTYVGFNIRSSKNRDANVVGVELVAITQQSLEGAQTPADLFDSAAHLPVLLESGDVCNNVVLQVKYTVTYNEAGEIQNVTASVLLGAVKKTMVPIQQEFQITFVQDTANTSGLRFSGNPGYVVGRPLRAGQKTANGILQSADPNGAVTVLQSSADQDCLASWTQRSPVLFGVDVVSGCTLKLSDVFNCSLASEVVIWALKGQNFPDYVASFGNSLPEASLDWVPIQNQTITSGTDLCGIPLYYHLEVKWTKYGTLLNPQAQIVSVMETIITNTSSLVHLISADGLVTVSSSVSFTDVSASAHPGYKVPPTIDAKLPFDFFFPFV